MNIEWFELNDIDEDQIKYVVVLSEFKKQFVLIRNKNRDLWEIPGGKREDGELIISAASRELYEETGAVIFDLLPFGIYKMNDSFGMVFYSYIEEFYNLPDYEIAEIKFSRGLPTELNYGSVYYEMLDKWLKINSTDLEKYKVNYKEHIKSF